MKTVKCAELVLDFDFYPRNNVDSHNVRNILDALATGAVLPPVIADRRTKRVADGFHRIRALIQRDGDAAVIDVIFKDYKDDAALFLDAMRYNAGHGAKLDPCDRTRCVVIAERLTIPLDALAGALHMPADKLGELRASRTAVGAGGITVPLKRTVHHFAGRKLNKVQEAANVKLSGMNQSFYANQLITLIESDMLDATDKQLMERLAVLHGLLGAIVPAKKRQMAAA